MGNRFIKVMELIRAVATVAEAIVEILGVIGDLPSPC
jgi:hypothetical protein